MRRKKSYKNRKKFSSLVIGACCAAMIVPCTLLPVFPGTAEVYAAQEFEGDVPGWDNVGVYTRSGDWGYKYLAEYTQEGEKVSRLYIIDYNGTSDTITIPDTIDGKKVYGISNNHDKKYGESWNVRSINVSKGIRVIGGSAFNSMQTSSELTEIKFEKGSQLTQIRDQAFYLCTNLEKIEIPDNVIRIGREAFDGCYNLTDVTFGKKMEPFCDELARTLGSDSYDYYDYYNNPFARSRNITFHVPSDSENFKVINGVLYSKDGTVLYYRPAGNANAAFTVPDHVKAIAANAFCFDDNLTSISLNKGLETIGIGAFCETGLKTVSIPDSVKWIDEQAFALCYSLETVEIGKGVTDLQLNGASEQFYGCSKLKNIYLPDSLKTISWRCFHKCDSLSNIFLPDSVQNINYGAFADCVNLTTVSGAAGLETISSYAFFNTNIGSFPYGTNVKFVSGSAFMGCNNFDGVYPGYLSLNADAEGDGSRDYYIQPNLILTGIDDYDKAWEVLELVNKERSSRGISPLKMDKELLQVAMQRAAESVVRLEASHMRPDGTFVSGMISKTSWENVSAFRETPSEAVKGWMDSEGHRANILNSEFKSTGIGVFQLDGNYFWVQIFVTSDTSQASKPSNAGVDHNIGILENVYSPEFSLIDEGRNVSSTMDIGKSKTLSMFVNKSGNASPRSFIWKSSNEKVAKVDSSGKVTAVSEGTATITAQLSDTSISAQHKVTVNPAAKVTLDKKLVVLDKGKTAKLTGTVTPASYENKTVTWSSSNTKVATVDANGNVKAVSHGIAKITAKIANGKTAKCEVRVNFIDVTNANEWYYKPVYWAAEKGITTGTDGKFFPADSCTREQSVTFLWRMAGRPEPKNMNSPYSDVKDKNRYSYKAIMWGTEKGVITGTDGKFYPTGTCTREQIVTMIWRLAGKPEPKNMNSKFKDVTSKTRYSYKAVMWAAENGITTGTNGLFYPTGQCKRREIVTFIYRYKN